MYLLICGRRHNPVKCGVVIQASNRFDTVLMTNPSTTETVDKQELLKKQFDANVRYCIVNASSALLWMRYTYIYFQQLTCTQMGEATATSQ